ncbi:MAG: aminodeoxychorismate synthase component I [Actinobacteria bacterium]|nr:aminodeoxychorismate synthase component I [Actinomycetota bacterium]
MPLLVSSLRGWSSLPDVFVSFFGNSPNVFWLDRSHHPTSGFSVIGAGVETSEVERLGAYSAEAAVPFRPYLVGVLSYLEKELKGHFLKVDRAIVFEHATRMLHFIADCEPDDFQAWYHAALLRLALVGGNASSYELDNPAATSAVLKADDSEAEYLAKIERAQRYIEAGDVYQLCLTTRLRGYYTGDPLSYFLRLRKQHSAPYATFMRIGNRSYVSISPERLIEVHGSRVLSSPIKGTRRRGANPEEDLALIGELAADPKERAENLMIVDLIRNDLASVCDPASVTVESLLGIKSYSTVHQLVSDVSGELREDKNGFDALQALFPGGSMTGAPKIRAMEIIRELESSPRGDYSGGIGWIGKDGSMDLGMVIRTAIFEDNQVSIGIGGGITSDSVPAIEHREIQLKADALVSALSANVDW